MCGIVTQCSGVVESSSKVQMDKNCTSEYFSKSTSCTASPGWPVNLFDVCLPMCAYVAPEKVVLTILPHVKTM